LKTEVPQGTGGSNPSSSETRFMKIKIFLNKYLTNLYK
jgi:hypothetical protein